MTNPQKNKLPMHTPDLTDAKIAHIASLFPHVITETKDENGNTRKAIDFDLLRQELSHDIVEWPDERYRLDRPGKKASLLKANTPITKTLRPVPGDSVDRDTTQNLYIEWDNFEVLKILQESYLHQVKMIYIDPPYNTGKDFVYKDNFAKTRTDYEDELDLEDEEWGKLVRNTDTNGRFHSDWLSMMYERLLIARDLLRDDGVIFMSIDDNEVHNLRKIVDEVFGEENFVAQVIWERAFAPVNLKHHFSESHDYVICYAKNIDELGTFSLPRTWEADDRYKNPDNDPRWVWTSWDFSVWPAVESNIYEIENPAWKKLLPPNWRSWRVSKTKFIELLNDNRVWFGENGSNVPRLKRFLSDVKQWITPMTLWKYTDVWHSQEATKKLKELFGDKHFFDYSKPVTLIKQLLQLPDKESNDDIILDFFSWSATTAHAVMELNAEDGGNRKHIMVQLPEAIDEWSEAHKAWYKYITEIGKERIRRAGQKILADHADTLANRETPLDIWFRVFRTDSTNMKDVYYHPSQVTQETLIDMQSNIKDDRTPLDLLTQVMLDLAVPLSLPIQTHTVSGFTFFVVWDNALIACFDENIDVQIVDEIVQIVQQTSGSHPLRAVFRDSSFRDDKDRINLETTFQRISPETRVSVL